MKNTENNVNKVQQSVKILDSSIQFSYVHVLSLIISTTSNLSMSYEYGQGFHWHLYRNWVYSTIFQQKYTSLKSAKILRV